MADSLTYNLGTVTAYGSAKEGGYTGTYEEFCESLANAGTAADNAAAAATSASAAEASASTAATSASTAASNASASAASASTAEASAREAAASAAAANASTTAASTAAAMTDTSKVYVYTGSETGYTNGNWYYYDGSAWVSGGVFNAAGCDDALSDTSTNAVQNKVVNGAIDDLKSALFTYDTPDTTVFDIEQGGLSGAGANLNGATYLASRRREKTYVPYNQGAIITCDSIYDMAIYFYTGTTASTYISNTGYIGSSYVVPYVDGAKWVRLVMKRADDANFDDDEIPTITYSTATGRIDELENETAALETMIDAVGSQIVSKEIAVNKFVNGAYSRTGSQVATTTAQYYLITTVSIAQNVASVKANEGYKVTVIAFDDSGVFAGFLGGENTITTVSSTSVFWTAAISFDALREKYPSYSFRLEMVNDQTASGTNTVITTAEESNAVFYISSAKNMIQKYYEAELESTIESVRSALTEPALVFPLVTDIHYLSINNTFDYCINNMIEFCKSVKCDFLVNLGDSTDGDVVQATTLERNYYMLSRFNEVGLPYYHTIGNHDTNYYTSGSQYLFTSDEIYKSYLSNTRGVVFDMTAGEKNFYKDFNELGIRVVCLDSNHGSQYGYSGATATWLANTALDTNNIVIVCEHLSSIGTMNWNGQTLSNDDAVTSALQSFVNNGGTLIQLCGHSHVDYHFTSPWLTIYSACQKFETNDVSTEGYQAITGAASSLVSPTRTLGTASEDCWSIVVVKPVSKTITLIRFGAGEDRTFSFAD